MSVCLCRIMYIRICMYCNGLHKLLQNRHFQFCCSNQFAPFASSPCTAPAPYPPPVMTEPHPMAKQRPTDQPSDQQSEPLCDLYYRSIIVSGSLALRCRGSAVLPLSCKQSDVGWLHLSVVLLGHYGDSFVLAPILQCKLVMVCHIAEEL